MHRSVRIFAILLFGVSVFLCGCNLHFEGNTAVQEIFEEELIDNRIGLDDGFAVVSIQPKDSYVAEASRYEVEIYKAGERDKLILKRSFDLNGAKDVSFSLRIQRNVYDIVVDGYYTDSLTGTTSLVCHGVLEGFRLLKNTPVTTVFVSSIIHEHDSEHIPVKIEARDPNCGFDGFKEHWRCSLCGRLFSDEECSNEIEYSDVVIPKTGSHVYSMGRYERVNGDGHMKVCDVCGLSDGVLEPHETIGFNHDSDYHWSVCFCGYEWKDSKEPHRFSNGVCTVCSYGGSVGSDAGFDVVVESPDPEGSLIAIPVGDSPNVWSIEFEERNCKDPIYEGWTFQWFVEGVEQQFETSCVFTLETPFKQSYEVFCIFDNGKGTGSASISVTGQ